MKEILEDSTAIQPTGQPTELLWHTPWEARKDAYCRSIGLELLLFGARYSRIHSVDQLKVQLSKIKKKNTKTQANKKKIIPASFINLCASTNFSPNFTKPQGLASSSQGAKGPKAALRTQTAPLSGQHQKMNLWFNIQYLVAHPTQYMK